MVWTPTQTGQFIGAIGDEDLYALFHFHRYR